MRDIPRPKASRAHADKRHARPPAADDAFGKAVFAVRAPDLFRDDPAP